MNAVRVEKQKRRRYTVEEKMKVLKVARTTSVKNASARYGVHCSSIHAWRGLESQLSQQSPSSMRAARHAPSAAPRFTTAVEAVAADVDEENQPPGEVPSTRSFHGRGVPLSGNINISAHTASERRTPTEEMTAVEAPDTPANTTPTSAVEISTANENVITHRSVLIGFQGEQSGFTEIAARRTFSNLVGNNAILDRGFELTGYPNPVRMLEALHNRKVDYAIVPSDTLLSTTSRAPLDRLVSLNLRMLGEVAFDENVCVCALPGTELRNADYVMSDLQILSRYETYILQLEDELSLTIHRQVVWDSATAGRIVQEEKAPNTLVLCSQEAARTHGLAVLLDRIESNCTISKYTIVGRFGAGAARLQTRRSGSCKRQCTLLLSTIGRADLSDVVSAFAHLNLSIAHFSVRNHGDEPARSGQSCLVSYCGTSSAVVEGQVDESLSAAADKIVHLGNYYTCTSDD